MSAVDGFNPHPTRRPGATDDEQKIFPHEIVSILTRPEGRVLLEPDKDAPYVYQFQSSPDPKAGCYAVPVITCQPYQNYMHCAKRPFFSTHHVKELSVCYTISIIHNVLQLTANRSRSPCPIDVR